jgi:tRNA-dihydrouridine synthase B
MSPPDQLLALLQRPDPVLALAPMQDVTDLAFWRLLMRYGGADVYWTEYFRVHRDSRLELRILKSVTQNPAGQPVIAQLIGSDVPSLARAARELQQFPVAAIDLNLGCPAPVVYRKCAGGGLLRDLPRVDGILGALRDVVTIPFSVKTRIGFDSPAAFDPLLRLFRKHSIDLLTVHGRTVTQMYRNGVRYDLIGQAARELSCPVLANGNVHSASQAVQVLRQSGARGLMIGRGAIRNPWLFEQIRRRLRGETLSWPTGREVLEYTSALWDSQVSYGFAETLQTQRMKKFMNFIGEGVGDEFLFEIRRVRTRAEFFQVCQTHLDHDRPMSLAPLAGGETPVFTDTPGQSSLGCPPVPTRFAGAPGAGCCRGAASR